MSLSPLYNLRNLRIRWMEVTCPRSQSSEDRAISNPKVLPITWTLALKVSIFKLHKTKILYLPYPTGSWLFLYNHSFLFLEILLCISGLNFGVI